MSFFRKVNPRRALFEEITLERVSRENRLPESVDRSARLPEFIGCEAADFQRLAELDLGVVGVGSVGRRIALGAARTQPRSITMVDPGHVKGESLLTHPLMPQHVGESKALRTALDCKAISPGTEVRVFCGRVEELDEAALADVSLAALASDNLSTEVAAGQLFLHLGVPLVQASVLGELLVAQVRFFDNLDEESPCPACSFGPVEWSMLGDETFFRCDGSRDSEPAASPGRPPTAEAKTEPAIKTQPTMSTAFLCSLAASLGLNQIFRHILRLGQPVARTVLTYCGYTNQTATSPLKRNSDCPCVHVPWTRVSVADAVHRCSLRELATAAGVTIASGKEEVWFTAGDLRFHESAECCGRSQSVGRFSPTGGVVGSCSRCGGELRGDRFLSLRSAPASGVALDARLADLGAASVEHVVIRAQNRGYLVRRGGC